MAYKMAYTGTLTLTEFLLARIAEDEAVARAATRGPWTVATDPSTDFALVEGPSGMNDVRGHWREDRRPQVALVHGPNVNAEHIARHDPSRVLAECEAKRRIVEEHPRCDVHDRPGDECDACQTCGDGSIWPCPTLLHLCSAYADHPDCRDEWRA